MAPVTRSRTRGSDIPTPQQNKSTTSTSQSQGTSIVKDKKEHNLHKEKTEQLPSTSISKGTTTSTPPPHPPSSHLKLTHVARMYLVEAEEYVDKAEGFEKEAHRSMDEADCYSKRGEDFVEKALNDPGPGAISLYESARDTYNAARRCLEESVRCNDAATRNYRNARDYYEAYGRCSVLTSTSSGAPTTDQPTMPWVDDDE